MSDQAPDAGRSVSVVIPTIGRPELLTALQSALQQSVPPLEILLCNDGLSDLQHLQSDTVREIRVGPGEGGNAARQAGIDAAQGQLVALLDDDDEWLPDHLEMQLALTPRDQPQSNPWVISGRLIARFEGGESDEYWPARLIGANESISRYIFRKTAVFGGQGFVQASTLMFPRWLAIDVPFRSELKFHQDVGWLNDISRFHPKAHLIQVPEPTVIYNVRAGTVSARIDSRRSIDWAIRELDAGDKRTLGDFILSHSMFSAQKSGTLRALLETFQAAFHYGRPGLPAVAFAVLFIAREIARRAGGVRK